MRTVCSNFLDITKKPKLIYEPVQKQEGGDTLVVYVFSIAFVTAIVHHQNPVHVQFVKTITRSHLLQYFKQQLLTPFAHKYVHNYITITYHEPYGTHIL